jgi:hypothetical protein
MKLLENEFLCEVSLHVPPSGSIERTRLQQWLNKQHCGKKIPPKKVSAAHMDASYAMARTYRMTVVCTLHKDGFITMKAIEK